MYVLGLQLNDNDEASASPDIHSFVNNEYVSTLQNKGKLKNYFNEMKSLYCQISNKTLQLR